MSLIRTDNVAGTQFGAARRMVMRVLRCGIVLGLLYALYLVTTHAIARWHFAQSTPEELAKALEWDSSDALFYHARARAVQMSLEGARIHEVIRLAETAARLSPSRAQYWADLGGTYEWAGREGDAQLAYERARELFPNSPDINWKLGNFYLRAGEIPEALRAFRKALSGSPELRGPAYDVAWRAGVDSRTILQEMIPGDTEILFSYLDYLAETKRLDEAGQVWARFLERGGPITPRMCFPYFDALIAQQRADELRAAWSHLAERHAAISRSRTPERNLITNPGFESEILNGGLDWRIVPVRGVVARVDTLIRFDGARSLAILFDGTQNLDYGHVVQYIPVQPNTTYRFMGYLRTQGITTESGVRFAIEGSGDRAKLHLTTENTVGTSGWSPQQLEFRTGPDTRLLLLRVVRAPSHRFDNKISGTVWIDHVSLIAAE